MVDRLRLWRKSFNLYLSFLAFTDRKRPVEQLYRAMLSAVLSAVYDYDSDWEFGDRKGGNFLSLLQLIENGEARAIAERLFVRDVAHTLAEDGLDRGSVALRFYSLAITSEWLDGYTPERIARYGRKLQIVDDLLDLEEDRTAGDINCFLLEGRTQEFAMELREFLESDFFNELKSRSWVYRFLEKRLRRKLSAMEAKQVTTGQLFVTGRPSTGLYAFLLTLIGFDFYENTPSAVVLLTGITFTGITMSIMIFNDWMDRDCDRAKGKTFASKHSYQLIQYFGWVVGATALTLISIAYWSLPLAFFCISVWIIGILYSFVRRLYLVNNLIVAICAGSPALCGAVFHEEIRWITACTAGIFASLVFINEQYKDVKDVKADQGHKETMPSRCGTIMATWSTIPLLYLPTLLVILHPNVWVGQFGGIALGLTTFQTAVALLDPRRITRPLTAMRLTMGGLLVVLLLT
jgi:4-hydroxybenzoate polyprenyltransferase